MSNKRHIKNIGLHYWAILLFFFALIPKGTKAQSYIFRNYQAENGLSQNTVFCIMQSKDGFMWFGTKAGLNRFDGYDFKTYNAQALKKNGLGNNFIKCLFEDSKGYLWVGTSSGLFKFDIKTEMFEITASTQHLEITAIKEDPQHTIWYIANGILHSYNPASKEQTNYDFSTNERPVSLIVFKNTLYLGLRNGNLKRYDTNSKQFQTLEIEGINKNEGDMTITSMEPLNDHEIIIGTRKCGVYLYDLNKNFATAILSKDDFDKDITVRDILLNNDKIWIASESGIYIYNCLTKQSTNLRKDINTPNTISDNAIYSLYKDKGGAIWVGTYFNGINYCQPELNRIINYYPSDKPNRLSGSFVREIVKARDGLIWVGTEDEGLFTLSPKTQIFQKISLGTVNNIHGLAIIGDDLWVGTFNEGLFILNRDTKTIEKQYPKIPSNALGSSFIEIVYQLKSGEILVSTPKGIYKYNDEKYTFSPYDKFPNMRHCKTFLETSNGDLWGGSLKNGVYHFSKKNNRLYHYLNNDEKGAISSDYINYIYEDRKQNIWVCTENGLNLFDKESQTFKTFYKNDGFPSSVFYTLIEVENGDLWLSTSNGISKFNYTTKHIENYGKNNNLLANQFNYASALYDNDNDKIYFGSINGLLSLTPKYFKESNYRPPIYLTNFQLLGQNSAKESTTLMGDSSISYTRKINLPYDNATFSIEFAALDYENPNLINYSYSLKGASKEWIHLGNDRKVNFTNLESGYYQFQVKSGSSLDHMNSVSEVLHIHISPPFYLSKLAYIIYFLLLVIAVTIILKLYRNWLNINNKIKMEAFEKQVQKEVYQSKIEFFTNITHDIKTPLTLIKGPLDELLKKMAPDEEARKNLELIDKNTDRLLTLTNELLDFRAIEKENFHLSFVKLDIAELLKECYERFTGSAQSKNIIFTLNNLDHPFYAYANREALIKIVSNLIDNAIKYGNKNIELSIQSNPAKESFNIVIVNDGDLIPKSTQSRIFEPFFRLDHKHVTGTGLGLPLSHTLAKLHEGDLTVHTTDNQNIFVLNLPIHHDTEFKSDIVDRNHDKLLLVEKQEGTSEEQESNLSHILIVDDNLEILQFLYNIFSVEFHVSKASSVKEAMEIQGQHIIKLIISDVIMPDINGYEFCTIIKENVNTAHIPIILLTAKNSIQAKIEGLNTGADAYIEKPFSSEHLIAQAHTLINNREWIKTFYANTPTAHLNSIAFNKTDEDFLQQVQGIIIENIKSSLLSVDFIAEQLNMSRGTFYRKIKAVSNLSPNELILVSKLKKAAELLAENRYKIFEVANKTGFSSQAQFTRNFSRQFKCTPSEYVESLKLNQYELNNKN